MKFNPNVSPYFDDFNSSNNFMKVLFRPGRPVQGRELNTMQSISADQLDKMAKNIFKNGSKVSNGRSSLRARSYVRLLDVTPTSETVNLSGFSEGTKLVGEVSGVEAIFVLGVNAESSDPPTLFVVYTKTGIDGEQKTFIPGEVVAFKDENNVTVYRTTVRCPSCPGSGLTDTIPPLGTGQLFTVDEGVFYYEGMFIENSRQTIVVVKYLVKDSFGVITNSTACKIGFDFVETIVTHEEDPSLLDPALGYPNAAAPGADRYKVDLKLVKRSYEAEDGETFLLLCKIGEQLSIEYVKADSEYADIMDTMAKRTFEQAGDYTVRPFRVQFLNHKKSSPSDSLGWSNAGDVGKLVTLVSPSVAYVKGYRVETVSDLPIAFRKARDTKKLPGFIKRFDERSYLTLKPKSNAIWPNADTDTGTISRNTIDMYDGPLSAGLPTGNLVGSFKVSDISFVSGNPAAFTAIYKYYVYDLKITMGGKKLSDVKSMRMSSTNFVAEAVVDTVSGDFSLYNSNSSSLIAKIDRDNVASLRDVDNSANGSIDITLRRKLSGTLDGAGSYTFNSSTNEFFDAFSNATVGWVSASGAVTTLALTTTNTIITPTTLTVNAGATHAGKTLYMIVNVIKTNQKEKTKTSSDGSYTSTTAPSFAAGDKIYLGKADAYKLLTATITKVGDPLFVPVDVTNEYKIVQNVTETGYYESYAERVVASTMATNVNLRITFTFKYLAHSGTAGYFTIDSYSSVFSDSGSGITYENLGSFIGVDKSVYPLNSSFDFRPIIMGTDPISSLIPAGGSTAIFDIEYYLARADLLLINKDGKIYVREGTPSDTPRPPKPDDDSMPIYEIWLKPYTYSLNDVSSKYIENRRYTMRDIGKIDDRLKNVEYYTAFSLLEKSAADMSIKDSNGLDRFKNGFIADNFSDFQAADMSSVEFKAAVDRTEKELRPSFKTRNTKLAVNESKSENLHRMGNIGILPFTEEVATSNPFATKHISVNPYFQFSKRGTMVLSPNNDVWTDEEKLPNVVVDIDSGTDAFRRLASASGVLGTDWGSWIDQNRTILSSSTTSSTTSSNSSTQIPIPGVGTQTINTTFTTTSTATTNTIATTQIRSGVNTTIETKSTRYNINDIVKDVHVIPYIRESVVEFYATKMKPNTKVYAFFDGVGVSEHCRDIGFQLSSANASVRLPMIEFGSDLVTDANGEIRGEFKIPGGKFFVGEKKFVLSDDPGLTGDIDLQSTSAEAVYFAGGLDVSKQSVSLNVITPQFITENVSETRTVTSTETVRENSTTTTQSTTTAPSPQPDPCTVSTTAMGIPIQYLDRSCLCARDPNAWVCRDPVAQAFMLQESRMITSIDVFFKSIDALSDKVFVELRNMVNGYPGPTVLSRVEYLSANLISMNVASDDSSKALKVTFPTPVYVEGNTEYCFVVGGYSPNTRIWVSRLGQEVVNMPGKIVETPPIGNSSFRSLNGTTWNAEQFEAIKFTLYSAAFAENNLKVVFENNNSTAAVKLEENPIEMEVTKSVARVIFKNHGFVENDKVSISLTADDDWIEIECPDLPPQIGQEILTVSGSGTITQIEKLPAVSRYRVKVSNVVGVLSAEQSFTSPSLVKNVRDNFLVGFVASMKPPTITLNESNGTIKSNSYLSTFPSGELNGISISYLNGEHTIVEVDSQDSFIINLPVPATASGFFGGSNCTAYGMNHKYDLFNVSGSFINYRGGENWSLKGVGHGKIGSIFESEDYVVSSALPFSISEDRYLAKPMKIASDVNENRVFGSGQKSVEITANLQTSSRYLSPVVNLDTFSITTISNRVEWLDSSVFNVEPNASGRFLPETNALLGSEAFKYVTKNVVLKNPADDLHIFFDVYKDVTADFDVYVKVLPVYGDTPIDQVEWKKVDLIEKTRSSVDLTDRIEYELQASKDITGWVEEPFISFKIKLVGKSKNSCKPPLFKRLRAIAVV